MVGPAASDRFEVDMHSRGRPDAAAAATRPEPVLVGGEAISKTEKSAGSGTGAVYLYRAVPPIESPITRRRLSARWCQRGSG